MVYTGSIELETQGFTDIIDVTPQVRAELSRSGVQNGIAVVFCTGSTGGVTTIEYEDGVLGDLKRAIEEIVPSGRHYDHDKRWGDGNGFSHVRAALMKPSVSIPVIGGELALGTWQQIVFMDFDNRARSRRTTVQIVGE
jgi:secondary thiamine-phosphate synthase enzyme